MVTPKRRSQRDDAGQTLRRTFAAGASLTALLLVVAIIAGAVSLMRLTEARETLLDGIGPAVRANQSLEVALLNQETGIRGYALTRNADFLTPYRDGLADEAAALAVLREHLAGRPEAVQVDDVERAVQAWRSGYAEPVVATPTARWRRTRPSARPSSTRRAPRSDSSPRSSTPSGWLRGTGSTAQRTPCAGSASRSPSPIAAFLAAAAWGLRRGVLEPIAALAEQVRAVVSGDVHREVRGSGPQEIVGLGADVDAMRVHISEEVDLLQEANQRLDEQARDLERSNGDLEQFAYVASHDLQEPLRKVASFCQLLQRRYGGQLDERADQYIGFAVDGAQRMQRLINDLLAFSRVGRHDAGFDDRRPGEIALAAAAQVEIDARPSWTARSSSASCRRCRATRRCCASCC